MCVFVCVVVGGGGWREGSSKKPNVTTLINLENIMLNERRQL